MQKLQSEHAECAAQRALPRRSDAAVGRRGACRAVGARAAVQDHLALIDVHTCMQASVRSCSQQVACSKVCEAAVCTLPLRPATLVVLGSVSCQLADSRQELQRASLCKLPVWGAAARPVCCRSMGMQGTRR